MLWSSNFDMDYWVMLHWEVSRINVNSSDPDETAHGGPADQGLTCFFFFFFFFFTSGD